MSAVLSGTILGLLMGCTHPTERRPEVSHSIEERTGHAVGARDEVFTPAAPRGIDLDQPISVDEAVAVALWNNAEFQAALADLGFSRAEVIRAGQLTNPTFSILFPVGPKQLEFAAKFPLEALWLRPRRIAIAEGEAAALAQRLVASGLDLVRDVKLAACELDFARERLAVLENSARLRQDIGRLAEARVAAGDASGLEASQARIDAARAVGEQVRLERDLGLAEQHLRALLGLASREAPIRLKALPSPQGASWDVGELQTEALAARPEVRAAELSVEAAGKHVGLAKAELLALTAILDANGSGSDFEIGPGLELPIPILNQNQAARALADARVVRAAREYVAVRERILAEVRSAQTRMAAANRELLAWDQTLRVLRDAATQARKAHELGEVSRLAVFELERSEADARAQSWLVVTDYRRAEVALERAVGHRLSPGITTNTR